MILVLDTVTGILGYSSFTLNVDLSENVNFSSEGVDLSGVST